MKTISKKEIIEITKKTLLKRINNIGFKIEYISNETIDLVVSNNLKKFFKKGKDIIKTIDKEELYNTDIKEIKDYIEFLFIEDFNNLSTELAVYTKEILEKSTMLKNRLDRVKAELEKEEDLKKLLKFQDIEERFNLYQYTLTIEELESIDKEIDRVLNYDDNFIDNIIKEVASTL